MRARLLLLGWLCVAAPGWAQDAAPGDSPDAAVPPARPVLPATPGPAPPSWQQGRAATLQLLDKINGQSATMVVAAGGRAVFRNLTVALGACYHRPADQPTDATALLVVTTAAAAGPVFSGWMLAAEPAASMMQDPVYDVRVVGCE